LSNLMKGKYDILGLKKVSTTAYHPQTDGLVERFNCTLTDMLLKKVQKGGKDWDQQLPYVLFACRTSSQDLLGKAHSSYRTTVTLKCLQMLPYSYLLAGTC